MEKKEPYIENKERDQDRVHDTFDHFKRFGYVMFEQNRWCYENIANKIEGKTVLEAGCGMGLGSNILKYKAQDLVATDKLKKNIDFAKALYPMISFLVWDISKPSGLKFDVVVCVEAIEHVKNYREAMKNLISAANEEVWVTTPNRAHGEETCPSNEFHVREFYPQEIIDMAAPYKVEIYHWRTMEKLDKDTKVSPLIYKICV